MASPQKRDKEKSRRLRWFGGIQRPHLAGGGCWNETIVGVPIPVYPASSRPTGIIHLLVAAPDPWKRTNMAACAPEPGLRKR